MIFAAYRILTRRPWSGPPIRPNGEGFLDGLLLGVMTWFAFGNPVTWPLWVFVLLVLIFAALGWGVTERTMGVSRE